MAQVIWRNRDFRLLWTGETVSQVGTTVTTVVLPLAAVTMLHAHTFAISSLTAAIWLPWVLIGLPAGAWIDRLRHRRRLMIGCDLASAALFATVPVAAALGYLTIAQLVCVALGAGCSSVLFTTAYRVYLIDLISDRQDRAAANGALQGSQSAAQIAGPGLGGLLAQSLGAATAMAADSISFLVSAVCLASIRAPAIAPAPLPAEQPLRRQVLEGIRYLRRDALLRPLVLFGGAANLALTGYQSILVVFLVRDAGLGSGAVGVVLAVVSCGGVLGALAAKPLARALGSGRAMLICKAGATPFALLIPLATSTARSGFLIVGGVLVGAGIVAGNVISTTFTQSYVPPEMYARISATTNVLNYGTMPVGALVAGAAATAIGLQDALWVMTALLPASAIFLIASPLRSLRILPDRDQAARHPASAPGHRAPA